jgi:crotonobetainyl-CoA:carnitine CoA-transferase CaiB-like acyl-CoA transferase
VTQLTDRPLAGLRVLDLTVGNADLTGRILADLGADVLKIEPPEGSPARGRAPLISGVSIEFALHNANKRCAVLDPADDTDRQRLLALAAGADVVVDEGTGGLARTFGTSCSELADRFERLVALCVTDFGADGPRASWVASDAVLTAMSTVLSRSGRVDGVPILPPRGLASGAAAVQAVWAALVAYFHRLRCGRGDYIDFSRHEAVLQSFDPPFGSLGQAAAARRNDAPRNGRTSKPEPYPIFACQDGWVRICVLAPRQWRGLRSWLGEPEAFQDPQLDSIAARAVVFDQIASAITEKFAGHTADELVAAGIHYGVPVAALGTVDDVVAADHFAATRLWTDMALTPAAMLAVPDGCIIVDGQRLGLQWAAPAAGSAEPVWSSAPVKPSAPTRDGTGRPFAGLRILDLGVIVAGGELGRLFSDLGAEVIKVESASYPDGLRQAAPGQQMSESFAWTHRNQESLGLDLRTEAGAELFGRLVAGADAVFANFKPGTLAGLGFSHESLRAISPAIVLTESSAYGDGGPWRARMGYGPLVRAATGITGLWASDADGSGRSPTFCDRLTVFPDHVAARYAAVGALAALIQQGRTGVGAHVHISQAEVAINQLDVTYATEVARTRGLPVTDDVTLDGVYPSAGADDWCVIGIGTDEDWRVLTSVMGRPELADDPRYRDGPARCEHRNEVRALISDFTSGRKAATVAALLQDRKLLAARMNRAPDVLADPQVRHRSLYTDMRHPLLANPLPSETGPARYRHIEPAELRPAPMLGEHTRDIALRVLGLTADELERLIAEGVLFAPPVRQSAAERSAG